jgi:hypothetical protein
MPPGGRLLRVALVLDQALLVLIPLIVLMVLPFISGLVDCHHCQKDTWQKNHS